MASAQDVANRIPITAALILGTLLMSIDGTIANVALPHMQGSFSASQEQTAWVLTSYIVAAAIMTPLSGWLATRVGYRRVFLLSIAGFTIASVLCGSATSLVQIVAFRFLQGLCGAALQPLVQAVMLDLYAPSQIGQVLSIWGAASFLGPIIGPVLGGWLTDNLSWRWVFYINLPVGALSFAGVWLFMSRDRSNSARPFDFLGFGSLVVFVSALQLMLDRGSTADWFASTEIRVEGVVAAIALYVFVVHILTATHPLFDRGLARDRNFMTANLFSVVAGVMTFSTLALQPPLMQGLMGYSVLAAGVVMMPRGVASLISMLIVGRLVGRVDTRLLLTTGLVLVAVSMLQMSHFDLSMSSEPFITSALVQGFGMGLIFVPMSSLGFATIAPRLRADGAIVYALTRSLGQSVGISAAEAILTNRMAAAHGDLAAQVQPGSPAAEAGLGAAMDPANIGAFAGLNGEITRQASMIGYVDVFHLGLIASLAMIPLVLLLRPPRAPSTMTEVAVD